MGLFLGNLHILSRNENGRTLAVKALRQMFAESGYEETSDSKQAQVNVAVITAADQRWTSLYCADWESDSSELLTACAKLSKATKVIVLGASIHDSDAINLGLFDKGKLVDRFSNDPEFFGEDGSCRGNPRKWQSPIEGAEEQKQLRTIWDAPYTFVEGMLRSMANLLKIPEKQLCALAGELGEFASSEILSLNFRKLPATAVDRVLLEKSEMLLQDATYQNWLKSGGTPFKRPLCTVGAQLTEGTYFINRGIPFKGFALSIDGSAIKEGLVSFKSAVAKYHATSTKSAKRIGFEQFRAQVEQGSGIDAPAIWCRFDEATLTSCSDPADRFRISILLDFKAEKVGVGTLKVRVIPSADAEAAMDYEYPVEIV